MTVNHDFLNTTQVGPTLEHTTLGNYKFKFSAHIQQIWKNMQTDGILLFYMHQS